MIRTLVVEDEPLARQFLRTLLAATGRIQVVGEAGDGREALRLARDLRPDAAFLDIRMPGPLDGVALARELTLLAAPAPMVVFVTGHADRAIDAFRVEAVDYLLKPIEAGSVAAVVQRLQRRLAERADGNDASETANAPPGSVLTGVPLAGDRLPVKTEPGGDVLRLLAPGDIVAALRRDRRTFIHTATAEFATYYAVGALAEWLDGLTTRGAAPPFVLAARDALVNLYAVAEVVHYGDRLYQVRVRDRAGTVVEASRSGAARLAAHLKPPV